MTVVPLTVYFTLQPAHVVRLGHDPKHHRKALTMVPHRVTLP